MKLLVYTESGNFSFTIDSRPQTDTRGQYVKIGSWIANYWFHVAVGKTVKQTLSYAKRHLRSLDKLAKFKYSNEYNCYDQFLSE